MEKKSESLKQGTSEFLITKEQQFYEDVRFGNGNRSRQGGSQT